MGAGSFKIDTYWPFPTIMGYFFKKTGTFKNLWVPVLDKKKISAYNIIMIF